VPPPHWQLGLVPHAPHHPHAPRHDQLAHVRAILRGISYARRTRLIGAAAAGVILGGGLYLLFLRHFGPADARGTAIISLIVGTTVAWATFRLGARPVDIALANQLLLACRLCACCSYDLADLKPEPDGCTICPECGAAWDLRSAPDSPPEAKPPEYPPD
jgi:hypothetical protein